MSLNKINLVCDYLNWNYSVFLRTEKIKTNLFENNLGLLGQNIITSDNSPTDLTLILDHNI